MKTLINHFICTIIFCGLLLVDCELLNAQVQFQKHFSAGTSLDEAANCIKVLPNGNYIIGGVSNHASGGSGDFVAVELDVLGNKLNEIAYGNSSWEYARNIVLTDNGYFVLYGQTVGALGDYDVQLVAVDYDFTGALGDIVVGSSAREVVRELVRTHDGGFAGVSWSNTPFWDHYVAKINANGTVAWGSKWGGTGTEKGETIYMTSDNGFIVSGEQSSHAASGSDIPLVKLNSDGSWNWGKLFNATTGDNCASIIQTKDGGYILSGTVYQGFSGGWLYKIFLMKVNSTGDTVQWSNTYGNSGVENWPLKVIELEDSSLVVTGRMRNGSGNFDGFLFKTDKNGNLAWSRMYGSSGDDRLHDVVQTPDGGFMMVGRTTSFGATNGDWYFVKTDANGLSGCNEDTATLSSASQSWSIATQNYTISSQTNNTTAGSDKTVSFNDSTQCIANDGSSCANAYLLTDADYNTTVFTMTDTVMWFRFVADEEYSNIYFVHNNDTNAFLISDIKIYESPCVGDTVESYFSHFLENHEIFKAFETSENTLYLIKVTQPSNSTSHFRFRSDEDCGTFSSGSRDIGTPTGENCDYYLNYYPVDNQNHYTPVKKIRIVMHLFNNGVEGMFPSSKEDIKADFLTASNYSRNLTYPVPEPDFGYSDYNSFAQQEFPSFNSDSRIEFVLDSIFFYEDSRAFGGDCVWQPNRINNLFSDYVTNATLPLSIRDSAIHVFGIENCSGQANGRVCGIPCSNFAIFSRYSGDILNNDTLLRFLILHEFGHNLGLRHPYDSPGSSCAYNSLVGGALTNNMMGALGGQQDAITSYTSCQVANMHFNIMNNAGGTHRILIKDYCEKIDPTVIINAPGQTIQWLASRYMKGDFVVKSGTHLIIKCLIGMPQDGKIIVERGAKLTIDGGTITNVCGNFWYGIEVLGNDTMPQPLLSQVTGGSYPSDPLHHGVLIMKNGATLENAWNAVSLVKHQTWGLDLKYTGGIVVAQNSTFQNNARAVEFIQYLKSKSASLFENCTFQNTRPLYENRAPGAFVTLWGINGVQFRGNIFQNTDTTVTDFMKLGRGIYSEDAAYSVLPYYAPNTCYYQSGVPCPGTPNTFTRLTHAVSAKDTKSQFPNGIEITGNVFEDNYAGIWLKGTQRSVVVRNEITVANHANTILPYGVLLQGSQSYKVEENIFNLEEDYSANWSAYGLYADETGSSAERIYGNTFNGGDAYGHAIGAGHRNMGLQIKCNTLNEEMYNILALGDSALYFLQGTCNIIGVPVTQRPNLPAGNFFSSTCDTLYASHLYANGNMHNFKYHYHRNTTRREPICINDQIKVSKEDCNISPTGSCQTRVVPYTLHVEVNPVWDDIRHYGLALDTLGALFDNGDTYSLLAYVSDYTNSAQDIADSLLNSGWLSDKVLLAAMTRTPALSKVNKSLVLMKNSPHTPLINGVIIFYDLQATIDSLDNAGVALDTATQRYEDVLQTYYLLNEKEALYNDLMYLATIDTLVTVNQIIDTLKTEAEIGLKLKLLDLFIATQQHNHADTLIDYLFDNANLYGLGDYALEATIHLYMSYLDNYMQKNNETWFNLLGSKEHAEGEPTYEEIIDFLHEMATYPVPQAKRAENVLTMLFDSVYLENLLVPELIPQPRKGRFNEETETKEIIETEMHDYRLKPNFFEDRLLATITLKDNEQGFLEIYNLQGTLSGKIILNNGKNDLDLTPINLSNGVYLYRVWADNEIKKTDKLIKLK